MAGVCSLYLLSSEFLFASQVLDVAFPQRVQPAYNRFSKMFYNRANNYRLSIASETRLTNLNSIRG